MSTEISAAPAGQALAFIAYLGLKYVIITVNWLGGLPFASREISLPLYLVVLSYILIFYFLSFRRKSESLSVRRLDRDPDFHRDDKKIKFSYKPQRVELLGRKYNGKVIVSNF